MKQISDEEFKKLVQDLIDGTKRHKHVIEDLETDSRTLNNKIAELSVSDPELYREYAIKHPYKPRKLTHIDYEALLIHAMRNDLTLPEAGNMFGAAERTIRRNIKIEEISPEIINLYRIYAKAKKTSSKLPDSIEQQIDELVERPVVIDEVTGKRKRDLVNEIKKGSEGMRYKEAAKKRNLLNIIQRKEEALTLTTDERGG